MARRSRSSVIPTTTTAVCPSGTVTQTGDLSWDWLAVDPRGRFVVSADGQSIMGQTTEQSNTGATIHTVWKFTALRQ
jgi:hypothetical protein